MSFVAWAWALLALSSPANVGSAPMTSVLLPPKVADAVSSAVASARDEVGKGTGPLPACSPGAASVTFGPSYDPTHAVPIGPGAGAFCGGPGISFGVGFGVRPLGR